jgi:hypothetical protein
MACDYLHQSDYVLHISNSKLSKQYVKRNLIQKPNTKLSVESHRPSASQVLWRSKHPLLIGHIRRAPLVEIRFTGLPVVEARMEALS